MTSTSGPQSVWWALFSLKGRISRQTFILGCLFMVSLFGVLLVQIVLAGEDPAKLTFWGLVMFGLMAISAWSIFALCFKRLHDLGFPGMIAVCVFIPAISPIFLIGLAIMKGTGQTNAFGPPPFANDPQDRV